MNKAIALGADNGYMDKVETTIKSVCAHNDSIKFYVFNDDLPSEWFRVMNKRLGKINSQIVNAKISDNHYESIIFQWLIYLMRPISVFLFLR